MPESGPVRILYMEDDSIAAHLFRKRLREHGYEVETVPDGEEGLARFREGGFDILAVDQNMPVYEGLDVIRILSDEGTLPPTIMVTGAGDERLAAEAMKLGAVDYVVKDSDGGYLELLPSILDQVVRTKRLALAKEGAEAALQESEARFRTLVETAKDVIWTVNTDLLFTYVSPSVRAVLGYGPEELVGVNLLDLLTADYSQLIEDDFLSLTRQEAQSGNEGGPSTSRQIELYHKDGYALSFEVSVSLIRDASGTPKEILGVSRDVTERRRSEEALRRSEFKYRHLVQSSPLGVLSCDLTGKLTEVNPAAARILGPSTDWNLLGLNLLTFPPMVEARISQAVKQCLESGNPSVGEFPYKYEENQPIYTRVHAVAERNADGMVNGAQIVVEDISDQKRGEGLRLRSERLRAVAEMAEGVANNFHNALRIVAADAQNGLSCLESRNFAELKPLLQQVCKGLHQSIQTVRRLQQFARARSAMSHSQGRVFSIEEVMEKAIDISRLSLSSDDPWEDFPYVFEMEFSDDCYVRGEMDELLEVGVNLIINAAEAMPSGGTIGIKGFLEGSQVVLQVHDEGIGIARKHFEKMFDPFWTTKQGHSGMGLAVCLGIIRRHRGTVTLTSKEGVGTTFTVRLPHVEQPRESEDTESVGTDDSALRILVAGANEIAVRELESGLKKRGHIPIVAFSGNHALKLFEQTECDAVIAGDDLPAMSGRELAVSVHDVCRRRNLSKPPFVLLSDRPEEESAGEITVHPDVNRVLPNSVSVDELVEVIRKEASTSVAQAAFTGSIHGIDILEYVQLLLFTGQQVVLEIRSREGAEGLLYVDKGEIRHAVCGGVKGEEALYTCLNFNGGSFTSLPWREPKEVSITKPGEFLLMQAARKRDDAVPPVEEDEDL